MQGHAEVTRPHLDAAYLDPPFVVSGCQCAIGAHDRCVRAGTPGTGEQLELGIVGVRGRCDGAARLPSLGRLDDDHPPGPLAAEVERCAIDDSSVLRDIGPAPRLHHQWNARSLRVFGRLAIRPPPWSPISLPTSPA